MTNREQKAAVVVLSIVALAALLSLDAQRRQQDDAKRLQEVRARYSFLTQLNTVSDKRLCAQVGYRLDSVPKDSLVKAMESDLGDTSSWQYRCRCNGARVR